MIQNLSAQLSTLRDGLMRRDRRALSRSITLVESLREDHRADAMALIAALGGKGATSSLRLGLSGTPGVGKSTFIESFGRLMIKRGHRVAVLAVDPSSTVTGGSVLGDKTRMTYLVRDPNAFIRPSASGGTLGGVTARTREAIALCEAAGFDIIIVETVGVGQSEIAVSSLTDIFLLLLAPAGGDELQGVKRGIMEMADLIVVNKADGDLKLTAERTCADYAGALGLLRRRAGDVEGFPAAMTASALEETGIGAVADRIIALADGRRVNGFHARRRQDQAHSWFEEALNTELMRRFHAKLDQNALQDSRAAVAEGSVTPEIAARRLLEAM